MADDFAKRLQARREQAEAEARERARLARGEGGGARPLPSEIAREIALRLSATGAEAVKFANERPGLSVPQKDRVTAVIEILDKLSRRDRNVVRALVTEAKSEYPDVPPGMPEGTQPEDMERASLYYRLTEEEADRRWSRWTRIATMIGAALAFVATWGLQVYTLMQVRP
jgi:hypothetical protein